MRRHGKFCDMFVWLLIIIIIEHIVTEGVQFIIMVIWVMYIGVVLQSKSYSCENTTFFFVLRDGRILKVVGDELWRKWKLLEWFLVNGIKVECYLAGKRKSYLIE